MNVVLDTNVLASALLSPHGPPARILDLMLNGHLQLVYDDRIFDEYRTVLQRERFHFDQEAVNDILAFFEQTGVHITAIPLASQLADPGDQAFLEVAAMTHAIIITGNLKHFPARAMHGVTALSPAAFLQQQLR